jgi:DNA-binding Xre family transcriptional regulator
MSKVKKTKKKLTMGEAFLEEMTSQERADYDRELNEFVLSELILAIMHKRDLSVRKLAKLAGISPTIVQDIRSGKKHNLNVETFLKIVEAMRCSVEIVLGDDTPSRKAARFPFGMKALRAPQQALPPYEVVSLPSRNRK